MIVINKFLKKICMHLYIVTEILDSIFLMCGIALFWEPLEIGNIFNCLDVNALTVARQLVICWAVISFIEILVNIIYYFVKKYFEHVE